MPPHSEGQKSDLLAGDRRVLGIVSRPAGLWVDALEGVLVDERLAGDEIDAVVGLLQHPQIAVACRVHERVDRLPVVLHS